LVDVRLERGNVGVYTGVSLLGTSNSPRHDTNLRSSNGQSTTRVSLARVAASFTSADHTGSDVTAVVVVASGAGDDGNIDGTEVRGKRSTAGLKKTND